MSDLVRMSLSIEQSLFSRLEEMVEKSGYSNRSEFVRDMIRDTLVKREWQGNETALGTISLIYDHHQRELSAKLTHIQHHHAAQVLATTHVHLDNHLCAEMIMVKGKAKNITGLADDLRQQKGVLHAGLSIGTSGQKLK